MKHLMTFENYIYEFFDFEKVFDIDEDVLSYVFTEVLEKFPGLSFELKEIDNKNFEVVILESSSKLNLKEVFDFIKRNDVYTQIESHFDVMDFKIKKIEYIEGEHKIVLIVHQLVSPH